MGMRVVGIKTLKNKLSEYVRLAAGGERILVTDRDVVVAELRAPDSGTAETTADAVLADAVRKGWIKAPMLGTTEPPPRLPVARMAELLAELQADRSER